MKSSPASRRATPPAGVRGFTLVEVLVALTVVALGLTALMVAVSGTARTSGYLRDKTISQWIALNRLTQVRLMVNKLGDNQDAGQLDFAGRKWHYDTRYFDTQFQSMKRVEVRVYPGDSNTKSNPIAQATGFMGTSVGIPGGSNVDWTVGTTGASVACTNGTGTAGTGTSGTAAGGSSLTGSVVNGASQGLGLAQSPNCPPTSSTPAATTTTPVTSSSTPQGQISP
jgi:general secretion pathway protein I